jgi:predicted nicotinamide N-methyase
MVDEENPIRDFIRANTALIAPPACPEIRLHLATAMTPIWLAAESEMHIKYIAPPYWAFAWAGGQALARYILDSPWVVRGRNVLDFAAGSGIAGIAAALMGATHVEASDVDSMAAQAVALNAEGNGVSVAVRAEDVMAMPPGPWDVVLAGDICYEAAMTELCFPWLQRLAADGKLVLLSDPGRAYLPHTGLVRLAEYTIPTSRELEDRDSRETVIYQVEAKGLAAKAPE